MGDYLSSILTFAALIASVVVPIYLNRYKALKKQLRDDPEVRHEVLSTLRGVYGNGNITASSSARSNIPISEVISRATFPFRLKLNEVLNSWEAYFGESLSYSAFSRLFLISAFYSISLSLAAWALGGDPTIAGVSVGPDTPSPGMVRASLGFGGLTLLALELGVAHYSLTWLKKRFSNNALVPILGTAACVLRLAGLNAVAFPRLD